MVADLGFAGNESARWICPVTLAGIELITHSGKSRTVRLSRGQSCRRPPGNRFIIRYG
jgi:hypothetical protein